MARLSNVPSAVFDAHVAPHVTLADAARVAVSSRSLRNVAGPGVRARVDRTVDQLEQAVQAADGTVMSVGDGRVKVTADARPSQRVITLWLVADGRHGLAATPILVHVQGPGSVRVVRGYDPPALRAHPLLRRALRIYTLHKQVTK